MATSPLSLETLVAEFDDMLAKGQTLEAFERFYGPDVVMQENNEVPRVGKAANRTAALAGETEFEAFRGEIVAVAVKADPDRPGSGSGMVFHQYRFQYQLKGQAPRELEEVSVQVWDQGQIVRERFFYGR